MGYDFSGEADLTNKQLAEQLSKITPLKEQELEKLLPKKVDKQNFSKLIGIISSTTSKQKKLTELKNNIDDLGGVIITILGKLL